MARNQKDKGPMVTTTMRIPKKVLDRADRRAAEQEVSRTKYVVGLIEDDTTAPRRKEKPKRVNADIFG